MLLQNTFYIFGIICMTLYTVLLTAMIVLLFYIKKKISDASGMIENKLAIVKDVVGHPKETTATVSSVLLDTAITKTEEALKTKKRTEIPMNSSSKAAKPSFFSVIKPTFQCFPLVPYFCSSLVSSVVSR